MMEVAFESREIRNICESEAQAKRELGEEAAEALIHRLADLRAATSVDDLLAGRPEIADTPDSPHITVNLCNGYSIILGANHPRNPLTETGDLDWAKVRRIKVLRIERNDDQ